MDIYKCPILRKSKENPNQQIIQSAMRIDILCGQ